MTDFVGNQKITTLAAGQIGTTIPQQGVSINFDVGIYEMPKIISTDYCITTGTGAFSVGPITINAIVRVPDGSSWVIR
jgi:hypothetical protein